MAAAPIVGLAVAWIVTVCLDWRGDGLWWRVEPLNLSEAAALRDRGEVARQLAAGAEPHAPRLVRAGFLYQYPVRLTPADAAVRADRPEILQLLFDAGMSLDSGEWRDAWCAARSSDMRAVLLAVELPGTSRECPEGRRDVAPAD